MQVYKKLKNSVSISIEGIFIFQHYGFCRSVVLKQYLTEVPKLDNLAILCKRLTCLNSTNFRVKYSFNHFANCLAIKKENLQCQLKRKNIDIPDQWIDAILLLQFMRMLQTLSRGWDEAEFEKILGFIDQRFKITPKIITVSNIYVWKWYLQKLMFCLLHILLVFRLLMHLIWMQLPWKLKWVYVCHWDL